MTVNHHSPTVRPAGRWQREHRFVPLFWRLFLPNAAVLGAASGLLLVDPPNGRVPTILGGFIVLLAVNLALMRHAFAPLGTLADLARRVDPLRPGERLAVPGPASEVRVLTESFNEMLERLEAERRDSARRALAVEQEQRRRIARELHDELGQELTAARLQVAQLEATLGSDAGGEAAAVRRQLDDALDALRRISRALRPEALDDLGLAPALEGLCESLSQRTGIDIATRISRELPPLSSEGELVLFRVAQESLTNVVRHAEAGKAWLTLGEQDDCVVLEVDDDGIGIAGGDPAGGQGIRGMRERALLIGAVLVLEPRDGGGTRVSLRVPVGAA